MSLCLSLPLWSWEEEKAGRTEVAQPAGSQTWLLKAMLDALVLSFPHSPLPDNIGYSCCEHLGQPEPQRGEHVIRNPNGLQETSRQVWWAPVQLDGL